MRFIEYIVFIVGYFVTLLITQPGSAFPYEVPRKIILVIWSSVLSVIAFRYFLSNRQNSQVIKWLLIHIGIMIFVSVFFGSNFGRSIVGNQFRVDGIYVLLSLLGICFFVWLSEIRLEFGARIIGFGLFLSSVNAISSLVKESLIVGEVRIHPVGGVFGNSNLLGLYLAVGLVFIVWLIGNSTKRERKLWMINAFVVCATILLSQSWGAILSGLLVILLFTHNVRVRNLFLVILLIVGGAYISKIYLPNSYIFSGTVDFESRERILIKGLIALRDRPWGWGVSNFSDAYSSVSWPIYYDFDVLVDNAHMQFLEIMVTGGMLGIVSYLILIKYIFRAISGKDKIYSNFFVAYLFATQVNVVSVMVHIMFFIMLGYVARLDRSG